MVGTWTDISKVLLAVIDISGLSLQNNVKIKWIKALNFTFMKA